MQRIANKRVLITDAAGGIGQCIARTFKQVGAIVAVADRNTDALDADAHFPGDLTDKHYIDSLAQSVYDALDTLVNNAGVIARGNVTQTSDADFALSMTVNAVCPNEVDTPMLRSGFSARGFDPETAISDLDKCVPLGRIAQPEDILY